MQQRAPQLAVGRLVKLGVCCSRGSYGSACSGTSPLCCGGCPCRHAGFIGNVGWPPVGSTVGAGWLSGRSWPSTEIQLGAGLSCLSVALTGNSARSGSPSRSMRERARTLRVVSSSSRGGRGSTRARFPLIAPAERGLRHLLASKRLRLLGSGDWGSVVVTEQSAVGPVLSHGDRTGGPTDWGSPVSILVRCWGLTTRRQWQHLP